MLEIVSKENDAQAALEARLARPLEKGFPTAGSNQRKFPTMGEKVTHHGEERIHDSERKIANAPMKTLVPLDSSFSLLTSSE